VPRLAALLLLLVAGWVSAKEAAPAAADPVLEQRMMSLAEELRCLVCQNQSLADSNAPLAEDLRDQIREQMRKGSSDRQVIDYLVARYGDFVRYRPPLKARTILLWFGPFLLLVLGIVLLLRSIRRRRGVADTEISAADRKRAADLLAGSGPR
jgi:cytochrome c-type biogenesis protein CcmH